MRSDREKWEVIEKVNDRGRWERARERERAKSVTHLNDIHCCHSKTGSIHHAADIPLKKKKKADSQEK